MLLKILQCTIGNRIQSNTYSVTHDGLEVRLTRCPRQENLALLEETHNINREAPENFAFSSFTAISQGRPPRVIHSPIHPSIQWSPMMESARGPPFLLVHPTRFFALQANLFRCFEQCKQQSSVARRLGNEKLPWVFGPAVPSQSGMICRLWWRTGEFGRPNGHQLELADFANRAVSAFKKCLT
ncbi:hypothetical protein ElyMa_002694000 [Elysia marginata]|uniref:Uncharacterized protein n=1 Tax=Elysia marginata TaxID=1093978 RepID=A0AAV4HB67_9GAST|nr:hypothetical protein ElyMa_002694000 [Elysia marginata]